MDLALEKYKDSFFQQIGSAALFDAEGRYVAVNENWWNRYLDGGGTPTWELIGRDVREIIPGSLVHDVIRTKKPISGTSFQPEIGTSKMLVANYLPLFSDGEFIGVAMYSIFNNQEEVDHFYSDMRRIRSQLEYYQREVTQLQKTKFTIDSIAGAGKSIVELKSNIMKAAATPSVVLIEGETGSGKELVAQAIHNLSPRGHNPFVRLNCTTIPANLAESELFGYEGGSFTGAAKNGKIGKFEAANGGSIFLDEINSLPLEIQPKLLRVLQEREVEHVGGTRSIPVDVRMIAATNVPLQDLVESGAFRRDLFYRLNVFNIRVPPLRERKEDLSILTSSLIESLNQSLGTSIEQISDEALTLFSRYDWPGNVRELRNVLERAMNWKSKGVLWPEDFLGYFANHTGISPEEFLKDEDFISYKNLSFRAATEYFEKNYFKSVLESYQGNKKAAAEHIGLSRAMFYRKLEKYNLK